jgi:hypothetical protein
MKVSIVMALVILVCGLADFASAECSEIYVKVGAGYKIAENDKITFNGKDYEIDHTHPISARFEIAKECGNVSFGVAHHSQWATGAPFNDKKEYQKTEFFVDYKFSLGF